MRQFLKIMKNKSEVIIKMDNSKIYLIADTHFC